LLDQERLAALAIPLEAIRQTIASSNLNLPGGVLRGQDNQFLIRTLNELDDLDEIENLIVWHVDGASVRLREVAEVRWGAKDREEITRVDGKECIEIAVFKEGDSNTVTTARRVKLDLDEWSTKLPKGHELAVLFDQSRFIEQAVNEVRSAAGIGGLLAIVVLFLFLRDLRSTLIVAVSIPISVIATFLVMYRVDISLNIMSLGGLTLGIGMLVDSSIVVLESIYRKRQDGLGLARAAVEGCTEVGPAVFASTLTSVAVFLPIVFVEGVAGQLFRDQALTVTISLLASLVVAVTMVPMLASVGDASLGRRKIGEPVPKPSELTDDLSREQVQGELKLGVFGRVYDAVLRGVLRWRFVTLLVAIAAFAASIQLAGRLGTELIPELSEGEFFFEVNLPEGSSLEASDRLIQRMEATAGQDERVARHYSTVGSRLVSGGMSLNTRAPNLGQVNVVLANRDDRAQELEVAAALRESFSNIPDLEIKEGRPSYFSLETPVEVIIFGEDLDTLRNQAADLVTSLEEIPGLVDVRSSLEAGNPELQVLFDRDRVSALGLDLRSLSDTLRDRVQGVVPTRFKKLDQQIDIRVRNLESLRSTLQDVRNLVIPGPDGVPTRLLSVAEVKLDRGPAEIHRVEQQRSAVITARAEGESLGVVVERVERVLTDAAKEQSLLTELGGQNREMQTSFQSLQFAIALAIFLVYLVMASTFESLLHPLIVLFTVPLALVGVVGGLLLTNTAISVIVLIGCILLVGIVVNNSIVLIDTVNRLRERGLSKLDAVVRASHLRLRPILMTTLTTILGLLPMAISVGQGAELRTPLAITVASGLFFSTFLTLLVIPAAYMIVPSRAAGDEPEEMIE
ncbi:MAG: efflux RND transporter permease subunit, partial [Planctomycetota bacterium]